jgi:hypothetical protein
MREWCRRAVDSRACKVRSKAEAGRERTSRPKLLAVRANLKETEKPPKSSFFPSSPPPPSPLPWLVQHRSNCGQQLLPICRLIFIHQNSKSSSLHLQIFL